MTYTTLVQWTAPAARLHRRVFLYNDAAQADGRARQILMRQWLFHQFRKVVKKSYFDAVELNHYLAPFDMRFDVLTVTSRNKLPEWKVKWSETFSKKPKPTYGNTYTPIFFSAYGRNYLFLERFDNFYTKRKLWKRITKDNLTYVVEALGGKID